MSRSRALLVVIGTLAVGVGARLYLAAAFEGNFDERSYEIVAAIARRGGDVYAETDRYNYTPVWAQLLAAFDAAGLALGVPLHFVVRAALTLVDVANASLIGIIGRQGGGSWRRGFAAYLLNPVAILIVGYHGQFETLAALPLLLALALRRPSGPLTWALGTAAVLVKHLLAFQVWLLFWSAYRPLARLPLVAVTAAVFALSFVPYLPAGIEGIGRNVFGYGGLRGIYGFGSFLPEPVAIALFVAVLAAAPLVAQRLRLDAIRAMRLSATALLAFIFGIGEQYFLIPVLFGASLGGVGYWAYSAVATAFLLASPENVGVLPLPRLWNAVWLASLAWTAAQVVRPRSA